MKDLGKVKYGYSILENLSGLCSHTNLFGCVMSNLLIETSYSEFLVCCKYLHFH